MSDYSKNPDNLDDVQPTSEEEVVTEIVTTFELTGELETAFKAVVHSLSSRLVTQYNKGKINLTTSFPEGSASRELFEMLVRFEKNTAIPAIPICTHENVVLLASGMWSAALEYAVEQISQNKSSNSPGAVFSSLGFFPSSSANRPLSPHIEKIFAATGLSVDKFLQTATVLHAATKAGRPSPLSLKILSMDSTIQRAAMAVDMRLNLTSIEGLEGINNLNAQLKHLEKLVELSPSSMSEASNKRFDAVLNAMYGIIGNLSQ